jgi:hypothetical protein
MSKRLSVLPRAVRVALNGMSAAGGIERLGDVLPIPRLRQLAGEKGEPPSSQEAQALLVALERFDGERLAVRAPRGARRVIGEQPAYPGLSEAIDPLRRALAR